MVVAISSFAHAQDPFDVQFERVYGTSAKDSAFSVVATSDGGYLVVGQSRGFNVDGRPEGYAVKTDANGDVQWQQTYGDPADVEWLHAEQATDGGYILFGHISPSPVPASAGSKDTIFIKIDSAGAEQWRSITGGSAEDSFFGLVEAGDGGYVAVGNTFSPEIPNKDPVQNDVYVVKVSSSGALVRQVAYGALGGMGSYEGASDLVTTADGGYVLTGVTYTVNGAEWFLMKLDANLDKVWETLRPQIGFPWVMEATPDGGVIVAGGDDGGDSRLVKYDLDPSDLAGPLVVRAGWPKGYGGADDDFFQGVDVTVDGGYIATGWYSVETDLEPPNKEHAWVLEIDSDGNPLREGVFAKGEGFSIRALPDGAFIMAGFSRNFPTGPGAEDLYLVKGLRLVTPGTVEGNVFFDADATCSLTAGDAGTSLRLVKIVDTGTNATFLAMADVSGTYDVTVPPGNYTATLATNALNQQPPACGVGGQSYDVSVASGTVSGGKNFGVTCTCDVEEALSGGPLVPAFNCPSGVPTTPCFGYPWQVCYDVTNVCDKLHAGGSDFVQACINLPSGLVYDNVNEPFNITVPPPYSCSSNWHLHSSTPSQVCFRQNNSFNFINNCKHHICFPVGVDATFTGGTITAQFTTDTGPVPPRQCPAGAFPPAPPLSYDNDCSCDPNAKHVSPEGCGASGSITSQELTYRVDFQNLGAGPAHDVVVTDVLDSDLELETLRLLESSHTITNLQVNDVGELVVTFEGIELPAEMFDVEGSQGHVTFAITPKDPFVDDTEIENSASIVFDSNAPVITNTVLNTLYHGDPVPVVDFNAAQSGDAIDFSYTGGTSGATFAWDFGPTATPRTSTDTNPTGIEFDGPGQVAVLLEATKAGCTAQAVKSVDVPCETVWTASAFKRPMGSRLHRVGSRVRMRFELEYRGEQVKTQARLDEILIADFNRTPDGDCWPKLHVFNEDLQQEVALGPEDFSGSPPPSPGCFRFSRSGDISLRLKLSPAKFTPGTTYTAQVEDFTCMLVPPNNVLETRP